MPLFPALFGRVFACNIRFFAAAIALVSLSAGASNIITYPQEQRAFRHIQLANGLQVLLIEDHQAEMAAAAMDVHVGSGEDPPERNGLAHFLEHMLFLGTEKYPPAGEFQEFVAGHGGSSNAYTSLLHTNYHFDIDPEAFAPALDRFAQFFITPLLSQEFIARERRVVHSEFASRLTQESRRRRDVIRELVLPEHPLARFTTGNDATLAEVSPAVLQKELRHFFAQFYHGERMALVLSGPFSLDHMESWVQSKFRKISSAPAAKLNAHSQLFVTDFLPAEIHVRPKSERRRLSVLFPVPESHPYRAEKPLYFIGNLIGHEAEGSLLDVLKRRGWASSLSAGRSLRWHGGEAFGINIMLTEAGSANVASVHQLMFDYIDMIRRFGVKAWRFDELAELARLGFRFRQTSDSIREVSRLASRLHDTPVNDIFFADFRFDTFDKGLIWRYLDFLRRDNALSIIVDPKIKTDRRSRYYQTPYAIATANASWLGKQRGFEYAALKKRLRLPKRNDFIPQDLEIIGARIDADHHPVPEQISASSAINAWFLNDNRHDIPRGFVFARYLMPAVAQSPENYAALRVYARIVRDELNAISYTASLAGLSYSLETHPRGIDLKFYGYNDSLPELSDQVLKVLRKLSRSSRYRKKLSERYFAYAQRELIRIQKNRRHDKVYSQALRELPTTLYHPFWSQQDMLDALQTLTAKRFMVLSRDFFSDASLDVLAYGNFNRATAQGHIDRLARLIRKRGELTTPLGRVVKLSDARPVVRHVQVDSEENVGLIYIQGRDDSVAERARLRVLEKALSSPFYRRLRTEKQLGYIVMSANYSLRDVPGLVAVVQSPSHSPDNIVKVMREFFVTHESEILAKIERDKKAVISELRDMPDGQIQWAEFYWDAIRNQDFDFNERNRLIDAVRRLEKDQLRSLYRDLFVEGRADFIVAASRARLLPTQVDEQAIMFEDYKRFKQEMPVYSYP